MPPLTKCMEKGSFEWVKAIQRVLQTIKDRLWSAPILFDVECDASGLGIGVVLTQAKRPLAFFSEKLSYS